MLHRIAANYGTDPMTVLQWSPLRLGLAMECLSAADAAGERALAAASNGGLVVPVRVVGGRF